MAALVASTRPLPADLAITDRSRKFYNGTYSWDSIGFTDEHEVYREYDCLDPLARAPTPLPPMFPEDEESDLQSESAGTEAVKSQHSDATITSIGSAPDEQTAPCSGPDTTSTGAPAPRTPKSIRRFAIDLLNRPKQRKVTARSEVSENIHHDINTVSKNEATVAESEQTNAVEILRKSHELRDEPAPAKRESSSIQMPDTPPDSPVKTVYNVQNPSPASTISTLSPVPSNLSDQDKKEHTKIKANSTTHDRPSLLTTPSKTSPMRKKGATTRGVAHKVIKSAKRTPANKVNPPRRKDNSVEDFTLLELHSGLFLREGGLRRSARQAQSEGK